MSFDLAVFEQTAAPNTYEDFLPWLEQQCQWEEERDYNDVQGTSPNLSAWFMEMKENFPALNGPFALSDEEAFGDASTENHLTDYSIGSALIYGAFGWSVAEEAAQKAAELAEKHGVGFFDPQSGQIFCEGMDLCMMTTENSIDMPAVWEQIQREVLTLGDPERTNWGKNNTFITIWFQTGSIEEKFMQCSPDFSKKAGLLKRIMGGAKASERTVLSYSVEAGTGEKIFVKQVSTPEQAAEILHGFYQTKKLPQLSTWEDSGIL